MFFSETYASVPINELSIFAFISLLASFSESPERFNFPISGKFIEPSLPIE